MPGNFRWNYNGLLHLISDRQRRHSTKISFRRPSSPSPQTEHLPVEFSCKIMTKNMLTSSSKIGFLWRKHEFSDGLCNLLTSTWSNTSGKSLGDVLMVAGQPKKQELFNILHTEWQKILLSILMNLTQPTPCQCQEVITSKGFLPSTSNVY